MFQADISSSNPIEISKEMPLVRRRRPMMRLSSSPVTQVDAQGTAYLCFAEDHSWFQGNISTEDESNYSLYGERITVNNVEAPTATEILGGKCIPTTEGNNNSDANNNNDESQSQHKSSEYYRVTMIDHFSGQKYILPKIIAKNKGSGKGVGSVFTSLHGEVTFQVENVYKGQKADIMIHRYLGSPSLLGRKCLLYSGEINILFNDVGETGRSWSL